jgi:hypothetical protein
MIIKLTYRNGLAEPVLLYSDQATAQPLAAGQTLEMTFAVEEDADGVADLVLICEPQNP